ncbi:MAG TPA: hypothetical protein VK781_13430 [Solirubrobacteraceae bacterium]|nr:hypothetical protein [Solirubrobacteraceae bacterium]
MSVSVAALSVAMATPGSALAVTCANLNGTGSSLQKVQQETWTATASAAAKLAGECAAKITVLYAAEGSGAGLTEFGMEAGFELTPGLGIGGELDGFIGTDDPPTAKQQEEVKLVVAKHAGTEADVIAPLAAPIAMIMHLPTGCELEVGAEPEVTQAALEGFWRHSGLTWKEMLESGKALTNLKGITCEEKVVAEKNIDEVRSDGSGTSYAFKQWMCQIAGAGVNEWGVAAGKCEVENGGGAKEYINDSKNWPETQVRKGLTCESEVNPCSELHGAKVANEKGSGEVAAVSATANSIGYANTADAVAGGFEAGGKKLSSTFWVKVENFETAGEKFSDPLKEEPSGLLVGNCPTANPLTAAQETEAKKNEWGTVHLAQGKKAVLGYPACTLTYDVGWVSYLTAELTKGAAPLYYLTAALAEEIGNSAKAYFKYMLSATEGQNEIQDDYSPAPAKVITISRENAALITP